MRVDVEHCLILCKRVSYDDTDFEIEISNLLMDACIELKAARKVVEAARRALVEIVGRDGTMSHYVQLNVIERIARDALKELDGDK